MRRPVITAAFALLMLVFGQISVFAHEAAVQHVTCTEHGEQVEVAKASHGSARVDDGCGSPHWTDADRDIPDGDEHEHCTITQALRGGTLVPASPLLAHVEFATLPRAHMPEPALAHACDLLLIAPKTSPPRPS